jgi:hypothetical protein
MFWYFVVYMTWKSSAYPDDKTEISAMPGIIYSETLKQIVAARIDSGQEPYRTLLERIRMAACHIARQERLNHETFEQEYTNGNGVKAAAFFIG